MRRIRFRLNNSRKVRRQPAPLRLESLEHRIALSVAPLAHDVVSPLEGHEADRDLRISVSGHRYYVDPPDPARDEPAAGAPAAAAAPADNTHPLTAIPILHSNPSSSKKLYLDFDGEIVTGTSWNSDNNGNPIHAVAYDIDGDTSSFSDEELQRIDLIWQRVSEDFSPFDVDVTTEFPGRAALRGDRQAVRAIISTNIDDASLGGTGNSWFSEAGGVAFIGSWQWRSDTPVWVFYNELNKTTEKAVAEAASHELGHALGLSHDGQKGGTAYYRGHGRGETSWAPIMGAGYNKNVTQWSKGDYADATNRENDLDIITSTGNRVGFREDDHGNWEGDATPLERDGPEVFGSGIISRRNDGDAFSFEHEGGRIAIDVEPAAFGANLDVIVELYDDQGELLKLYEPLRKLSAHLNEELPAGTYYLVIDGGGYDDVGDDGYNDYASVGQYTISGQISVLPPVKANAGGTYAMDEGDALQLDASDSRVTSGPLSISWDVNGDGDFGDATGEAPRLTWQELGQLDPPIDDDGNYVVAVRVTDGDGVTAEETTRLTIWNRDPEVTLSGPAIALVGMEVAFQAQGRDIDHDPLTYDWNFNDGSPTEIGATADVNHVFAEPGSYDVEVTARDDEGGDSTTTFRVEVVLDLPRVLHASIEPNEILGDLRGIRVEFSHDVSASLDIADLLLFNATMNQLVPVANGQFVWIEDDNVGAWNFSALGISPGIYSVALLAAGVTNEAGQPLDGDGNGEPGGNWSREFTLTFGGDADVNYTVDFADFLVLATHFGSSGGWSDGDFTGDGMVDFADFLVLSQNFGAADVP